jgi:hypothetical protein
MLFITDPMQRILDCFFCEDVSSSVQGYVKIIKHDEVNSCPHGIGAEWLIIFCYRWPGEVFQ